MPPVIPVSFFVSKVPNRLIYLLLLSSILLNAVAVPVQQDKGLQPGNDDVSAPIIPPLGYPPGSPDEYAQPLVTRVKAKRKAKAKPISKNPKNKAQPNSKNTNPNSNPKKKKKQPWEGPVPTEAQIAKKCNVPRDKALFWSGTAPTVHDYAFRNKLVTDSSAYPEGYTWRFRGKDKAKNDEFAVRFSRVFARKASGKVHVIVPWAAGPDRQRYFHKYEWPILKKSMKSGQVTQVIQVNPNDTRDTRAYNPKKDYGFTKRATDIDLNNVPWDVDLEALDEAWKRANAPEGLAS